jgi:N-acetylglucosamine-6-sulfatase
MRRVSPLIAVVLAAAVLTGVAYRPAHSAEPPSGPNIVLVLTDDQRWDSLWAMPSVRRDLIDRGVTFSNAFVVNSLCCPSRTSILTGQYSHSTGVYTNTPPHGGFSVFDDSSTIATRLHDAGYRTALMGKYLNGYARFTDGSYVPPGWDQWAAFNSRGVPYYNYEMSIDGHLRSFGSDPESYSTDVLANQAVDFIRHTRSRPFFLYLAPSAPHGPATPAPRDVGTFSDLAPWRPASYNEADVSDKPQWVQGKRRLGPAHRASIDTFAEHQYESLQAVDDAVDAIVEELRVSGRLQDTMIVFMSDNGYLYGEHRLTGKQAPYEESIRVPLVIRYDPVTAASPGSRDDRLALNIDLAPTLAEVAGTSMPGAEGRSLLPLLSGSASLWRSRFLVEHLLGQMPTYCAVRDTRFAYVRYATGAEELYDLESDPLELRNVAGDPSYGFVLSAERASLTELCSPPPPGFKA